MKIFTLFCVILLATSAIAQSVGIGTTSPALGALLDLNSTTRGFLMPRMTTIERTAIDPRPQGLAVYDTDTRSFWFYNGLGWTNMATLALPYAGTANLGSVAFKIDNIGAAIQASSATSSVVAISGTSSGTGAYGVVGTNHATTGFGTAGFSSAGTGIYGFSSGTGTGVRALSSSGYALYATGNLRINGGNTNPTVGAVLTSVDASGNAVWKPGKIAFSVQGAANTAIPANTSRKVEFAVELFDFENGFLPYMGSTTASSSMFTAPVSGVYHFSVSVQLDLNSTVFSFDRGSIKLMVNGTERRYNKGFITNGYGYSFLSLQINDDLKLNAGDKVHVEVYHENDTNETARIGIEKWSWFSGHLVFAE